MEVWLSLATSVKGSGMLSVMLSWGAEWKFPESSPALGNVSFWP